MNFVNPSFVFLAMTLITFRVRADFYIARTIDYFAVPAKSWSCDGIQSSGKFTGVNNVYGASAENMIHFSVEAGLCGYEYIIDGYAGNEGQGLNYAIYSEGDGWTQIGTCWPDTDTLECGDNGAISVAYCKEDWIC